MAVTTSNSAPYGPPSAIIDLIDRYRNKGLTTPFNPEVLARAGVSESLIPRVWQSLVSLELITPEGAPTETLEGLRRAPEGDLKPRLAAWLQAVYADVFSFVSATDEETAIRDAFRAYNPVGQQGRMVSLFLGLCRAAGLRDDDQATSSPRPAARKPASSTPAARSHAQPKQQKQSPPLFGVLNSSLPPALNGLLQTLPSSGEWTKQERDKFVKTFEAVLDFSVNTVAYKPKADAGESDE